MIKMDIFIYKLKLLILNPLSLFLLILFPIAGTLFLGQFFEKGQKEIAIPIALVDEDKSDFSKLIIERLKNQERIQLHQVPADIAERMLARKEVDSVYILKEGFQEKLLQEEREKSIEVWVTPSSFAEGIVREMIASEVTRITSNIKSAERVVTLFKRLNFTTHSFERLWQQAYIYTDNQWVPVPLMTIHYEQMSAEGYRSNSKEGTSYSPFISLWTFFAMLSCFLASDWIVREKQTVFSRIQSTYRGVGSYLFQCSGALLILHISQTIISYIIFKNFELQKMNVETLGMMIFFVVFCLSLSIGVASYTSTLNTYYIMSFLLVFVIGILGGSFFPIQDISNVFAATTSYLPQSLLLKAGFEIQLYSYFGAIFLLWIFALRRLQIKL